MSHTNQQYENLDWTREKQDSYSQEVNNMTLNNFTWGLVCAGTVETLVWCAPMSLAPNAPLLGSLAAGFVTPVLGMMVVYPAISELDPDHDLFEITTSTVGWLLILDLAGRFLGGA